MKENRIQMIDRLVREMGCRLFGYSDTAHRGATYEQVRSTFRIGEDFADCWRRAYNAVVARERYQVRTRKEVYGQNL